MSQNPRVLLVGAPGGASQRLAPILRSAGLVPTAVSEFTAAKEAMTSCPELLITDVKLGAFNGLHLAIRAAVQGTPTIVVGEPDSVLEAEAKRQRGAYLSTPVDQARLMEVVRELLAAAHHTRRSARKQVPQLEAFVNEVPARVVDVSYEGLRLETTEAREPLPSNFTLRLPTFNFSCDVQRVWTTPKIADGAVAIGMACGAQLAIRTVDLAVAWRDLVDALPGLALSV